MAECPFDSVPAPQCVAHHDLAFAIRDLNPVSPGHTLVVLRRHVPTWWEATMEEQRALLELVAEVKSALDAALAPDGYNVGFNSGEAAGQTVNHVHLHVIPRFRGDMGDPRGGVRHVIPFLGNPHRRVQPLAVGGEADPFSKHVLPLFQSAEEVATVAAFVQESGLHRLKHVIREALVRGANIRVLTGDYLEITQASALETLHDWERSNQGREEDEGQGGKLNARVVEVAQLRGRTRAFHPKAWRFSSKEFGVAFVGSSNLSLSALDTGIEWNLRVDRDHERVAYDRIVESFEALWSSARTLDAAWIAAYALRAVKARHALPPGDTEADPAQPAPPPHKIQERALASLREGREHGRSRALVILATGLGKTWLAAFDYFQFCEEQGGAPPRLLFIAHRREILLQAAETFRRLLRQRGLALEVGWFLGSTSELSASVVFASVAKLSRPEHLAALRAERFDYVIVDEVHHSAAESYRRILSALEPRFLLGLTATPDRADAADVMGIFDDHVAYRATIGDGIEIGRLVPFRYFGVKDDIDYASIPWRGKRWDPDVLAAAAQTEARMSTLWRAWTAHSGLRTLVFCCSVAHAIFVKDWLRKQGVACAAVFSGPGSDDREGSARAAGAGRDRGGLCRRHLQRGRRCAQRRSRGDASPHRIELTLPPAARPRIARERGQRSAHGHRLRGQSSRVPRAASKAPVSRPDQGGYRARVAGRRRCLSTPGRLFGGAGA